MLRLNGDMKSSDADLSIGEVAQRFGLATHVLRQWESMGLLAPTRDTASRRRYGPDDVYRVAVIFRAKEAGFAWTTSASCSPHGSPPPGRGPAPPPRRVGRPDPAAQASLELIDCALDCDHEDIVTCPHFQAMVATRISPIPVPHVRVWPTVTRA